MQQKTQIEIELSETIAYSRAGERVKDFCGSCQRVADMASPQLAAILSQTTEREIYRLVEDGQIHFTETDRVTVCLKSLADLKGEI